MIPVERPTPDTLRGSMNAAEHMHACLRLLFPNLILGGQRAQKAGHFVTRNIA